MTLEIVSVKWWEILVNHIYNNSNQLITDSCCCKVGSLVTLIAMGQKETFHFGLTKNAFLCTMDLFYLVALIRGGLLTLRGHRMVSLTRKQGNTATCFRIWKDHYLINCTLTWLSNLYKLLFLYFSVLPCSQPLTVHLSFQHLSIYPPLSLTHMLQCTCVVWREWRKTITHWTWDQRRMMGFVPSLLGSLPTTERSLLGKTEIGPTVSKHWSSTVCIPECKHIS